MRSRTQHVPLEAVAVGPVVTPEAGAGRSARAAANIDELDAHRGIAALGIVVFHVYQFSNTRSYLYFGTPGYTVLNSLDGMVPWFFVLTAFLLFEPIARAAIEGTTGLPVRRFAARRAVRLLPAYWVAILVVWFFRQPALPGDWRDLLEHLSFTQVFDGKRIFYTIGPAWSLSVEVMFYLLLVGVAVGAHRYCSRLDRRAARVAVLGAAAGALILIGAGWKAWAFYGDNRPTTGSFTTWFGPVANLDVFGIGMMAAIAVAASGGGSVERPHARTALRIGGAAVVVLAFATRKANSFTGVYFSDLCAVGFAMLIAAAAMRGPSGRWERIVCVRPLIFVGTISYSVYLWHEPVLLALRGWDGLVRQSPSAFVPDALAVLIGALVVGWLSYAVIERPTGRLAGVFDRPGRAAASLGATTALEWETFRTGNPM